MSAPLNRPLGDDGTQDEDSDEEELDDEQFIEQVQRIVTVLPQLLPDAKIEVDGKVLTTPEIVASFQEYLDVAAAAKQARRQLDEALVAQKQASEALEAALRVHHATKRSLKN
jgi:hypothetical protein